MLGEAALFELLFGSYDIDVWGEVAQQHGEAQAQLSVATRNQYAGRGSGAALARRCFLFHLCGFWEGDKPSAKCRPLFFGLTSNVQRLTSKLKIENGQLKIVVCLRHECLSRPLLHFCGTSPIRGGVILNSPSKLEGVAVRPGACVNFQLSTFNSLFDKKIGNCFVLRKKFVYLRANFSQI